MDIGSISGNALVQQVGGVQSNKQTQQLNQNDDAHVRSTFETSRNVGDNAVRKVEENSGNSEGKEVNKKNESDVNSSDVGTLLDTFA